MKSLADADQLLLTFDFERTVAALAALNMPLEEIVKAFIEEFIGPEIDEQQDQDLATLLKNLIPIIEQDFRFLNVRLQIDGTDLQIKPFLALKNDSELLDFLNPVSDELVFLDELPHRAMINAAIQGSPELLTKISTQWFSLFPINLKGPEKEQAPRDALLDELTTELYESLADRWSFSFS